MEKAEHRKYLRSIVESFKNGKVCKHCGVETNPIVLEFHHRNPEEKVNTIPNLIKNGCSKKELMREINKCDILCANCHRKYHQQLKIEDELVS